MPQSKCCEGLGRPLEDGGPSIVKGPYVKYAKATAG